MVTLEQERAALVKADRDIEEGESRVAEQERLIGELTLHGRDTRAAEQLRDTLQATLESWREHRAAIVEAIERLEREQ